MASGNFFIAHDLLEACRGWQEVVNSATGAKEKDAAGQHAVDALRGKHDYYGASRVIVKSEVALMLPDGMSQEEIVWQTLQFDDLRAIGDLGRVQYVRLREEGVIAWMLNNAQVIDRPQEVELNDEPTTEGFTYYLPAEGAIRRPLYLPVSLIDYALCAN